MSSPAQLLLESIYLWPSHLPTEHFGKTDFIELADLLADFRPPNRTPNADVGAILFEGIVQYDIMPKDIEEDVVFAWAYSQFMYQRLSVTWLKEHGSFYNSISAPIVANNQDAFNELTERFKEDLLPIDWN